MKLQLLISAVNQKPSELIEKMNIRSDAILINQCGSFGYEEIRKEGRLIRVFSFREKGVGLSRNNALLRADGDICLFSDEDIRYSDDYEEKIRSAVESTKGEYMTYDNKVVKAYFYAISGGKTENVENGFSV